MGVFVLALQIELVGVRMVVAIATVAVRVRMLELLVNVLGVGMAVARVPVAVLVRVRALVGVIGRS